MGNYNCTTGSRSTAYSRLPSAHYSYDHDHDHDDREPLLRNFTQRVDEQQQQLLHQIHQVNTVKETTTSMNMSRHQPNISNSNPPASKPPLQPILKEPKPYIHPALEKELQELRLRVAKLENSCPSCSKQGKAMEKIKEKNATLEKKFLELTILVEAMRKRTSRAAGSGGSGSTPHEMMRSPTPDLIDLQTPVPSTHCINPPAIIENDSVIMGELSSMIPAPQSHEINNGVLINDLTGCLVLLIFLVAVLIGVLL